MLFFKGFIGNIESYRLSEIRLLRVNIPLLCHPAFFLTGKQYRGKESFCIIMKRFPSAVIINGRPGSPRPDIVQLPVNGSHTASSVSAQMLHSIFYRFGLKHLRSIQQGRKVRRIKVFLFHISHYLTIRRVITLMLFHNIRKNISVSGKGKAFHGFHRGKRLEAEFGKIAEIKFPKLRYGLSSMPDIPIMHISPVITVRIIKASSG